MPQSKAVTTQISDANWSLGDQYKSTGLTLATCRKIFSVKLPSATYSEVKSSSVYILVGKT
jgi:hypothetical protein